MCLISYKLFLFGLLLNRNVCKESVVNIWFDKLVMSHRAKLYVSNVAQRSR